MAIFEQYANAQQSPEQEAQSRLDAVYLDPQVEGLAQEFGFAGFGDAPVEDRVGAFKTFTNANWNFRNNKERWEATPFKTTDEQSAEIFAVARNYGGYNMVDSTSPKFDRYDYVTILGAGNDGPLLRVKYAKEQIENLVEKPKYMILLGSGRKVMPAERAKTDPFAPDAVTEFDLINAAIEQVYGVSAQDYHTIELDNNSAKIMSPEDKNYWKVRSYMTVDGLEILSVSAPQIEGTNRVNTADTYNFMREVVGRDMLEGKWVLNVTHAIYTPFQDMDARRQLAIPTGAHIDTIGFSADYAGIVRQPDSLLQEMNSAANSADFLQQEIMARR